MAHGETSGQTRTLPWAFFRLSPFPQIALRVMRMAGREDESMFKLAEIISSDPAFASELLTIANSPLFAARSPVTNILEAVSRLGTKNIQGICLTVAVRSYLGKSISLPAMQLIWNHNLAVALISEQLAAAFSLNKEDAYTAGILHDIGRLAMASIQPAPYAALLGSFAGPAEAILAEEEKLFGFDHCRAGCELIESWKLPHDFAAIIGLHHHEFRETPEASAWPMDALVHWACSLADAIGFAAFKHCEAPDCGRLYALLPERAARHLPDAEQMRTKIGEKIRSVEHW
jgi:putative nucleotidyltransferase with HDIG domain